jgi:FkbM family methyltransferase
MTFRRRSATLLLSAVRGARLAGPAAQAISALHDHGVISNKDAAMAVSTVGARRTFDKHVRLGGPRSLHLKLPLNECDSTSLLFGYLFDNHRDGSTFQVFSSLARSSKCVCDVGANVGAFTYLAAATIPEGSEVIAFEPVPELVELIRANIEANCLISTTVVAQAVGASAGWATLFVPHDRSASSLHSEWASRFDPTPQKLRVPMTSLDEFFADGAVRPDLIKIDVEQHEREVFCGMRQLLEETRPDIVVEIVGDNREGSLVQEIRATYGYHAYYIEHVLRRVEGNELPYVTNNYNYLFTRRTSEELRHRLPLDVID